MHFSLFFSPAHSPVPLPCTHTHNKKAMELLTRDVPIKFKINQHLAGWEYFKQKEVIESVTICKEGGQDFFFCAWTLHTTHKHIMTYGLALL